MKEQLPTVERLGLIDYLIIARKNEYIAFYEKYKKGFVSEKRKLKIHSGEWEGLEFKIKGKIIILLLDHELR